MKSSRHNPQDGPWSRRAVLAGLTLPVLAGCSSNPNSGVVQLTSMIRNGGLNLFGRGRSATLSEVAAISYATIGVRVGDSRQAVLVLASSSQDDHLWTSGAHIAIDTLHGRIMKTAGLPHNLSATMLSGRDPLSAPELLHNGAILHRIVDIADKDIYQVPVASRFSIMGPASIVILGATIKTVHVVEECSCNALSWDFRNEYWIDHERSFVWRSQQYVHPALDAIELEILRPPAS